MKIQTTIEINAPAAAVWDVFGEQFADVSVWADGVVKSSLAGTLGNGAVRTCDIKGVGPVPASQVTEELTVFDRETHALTYELRSGVPPMMTFIENAWTIERLGDDRCRVTSRATFSLKWWAVVMTPLMRFPLVRGVRDFCTQLRQHVEEKVQKSPIQAVA